MERGQAQRRGLGEPTHPPPTLLRVEARLRVFPIRTAFHLPVRLLDHVVASEYVAVSGGTAGLLGMFAQFGGVAFPGAPASTGSQILQGDLRHGGSGGGCFRRCCPPPTPLPSMPLGYRPGILRGGERS